MDPDSYIDRLKVDLKLPSLRSPQEAKDEADGIADKHVVPAVESVVEALEKEIDANIPQIEIDVGRVRLQDLRDAVESALREALEKYRTLPERPSFPSVESILEYVETGTMPWKEGITPFDPSRLVEMISEDDFRAAVRFVDSYSEKELTSLLMVLTMASTPRMVSISGEESVPEEVSAPAASAASSLSAFHQFRDAVLSRLIRDFPETAGVLTARLEQWRALLADPDRNGRFTANSERGTLSSDGQDREESALSVTGHVTFGYIEIEYSDIPAGSPLGRLDYLDEPGADTPDYIMSSHTPPRFFKKVVLGSEMVRSQRDVTKDSSTLEVVRLSLPDVGTSLSDNPGESVSDVIVSSRVPARNGKQEIIDKTGPGIGEEDEKTERPLGRIIVDGDGKSAPVRTVLDETLAGNGPRISGEVLSPVQEKLKTGESSLLEQTRRSFKYIEIRLNDIPAGVSVVLSEYTESPGQDDPEYIMSSKIPPRYYRKVKAGLEEDEHAPAPALGREAVVDRSKRTETGSGIDSSPDSTLRSDEVESVPKQGGVTETSSPPESVRKAFRYEEINLSDIPEGYRLESGYYSESPDGEAPDYIASPGPPVKYYKKVAVENSSVSEVYPSGATTLPAGGIGTEPTIWQTPDIWEIQAFESEVREDRIPVSDAGLVLLHPFIGRMMENLGLVEEGDFVSPLARIRAVHLLRDLTGSDEPHYNHNLLLEKVLCGLPVAYAIPPEWKPTDREKEEIKSLLEAVCDYWRSLSGSSIEALCGSFIRRPGAIERFEDTWTIRVEGNTIDILLDDLPWELSVIFLPWLKKPLAVEWQRE